MTINATILARVDLPPALPVRRKKRMRKVTRTEVPFHTAGQDHRFQLALFKADVIRHKWVVHEHFGQRMSTLLDVKYLIVDEYRLGVW